MWILSFQEVIGDSTRFVSGIRDFSADLSEFVIYSTR